VLVLGSSTGKCGFGAGFFSRVLCSWRAAFSLLSRNFAVALVLLSYAVVALSLGVFSPCAGFQTTDAALRYYETGGNTGATFSAFALGSKILLPTWGGGKSEVDAVFSGVGTVEWVKLSSEINASILSLDVDGGRICGPCDLGTKYPVPAQGGDSVGLRVAAEAKAEPAGRLEKNRALKVFKDFWRTFTRPFVGVELGGWHAKKNTVMENSIYLVDAPFHIWRTETLAEYLAGGRWPEANYGFVSVFPAAVLSASTGITPGFSYKLWSIALLFAPIAIFYLFSRKLGEMGDFVFLFASLSYLFIPAGGLVNGGWADLFLYGMTAHSLATYASLLFLFFACEYLFEGKRAGIALAALFFALALASNPRIAFALSLICGCIAVCSLIWRRGVSRMWLLWLACFASCAWFAIPFFLSLGFSTGAGAAINVSGYGVLGGVGEIGLWSGLASFMLGGGFAIALLSLAGAFHTATARTHHTITILMLSSVMVFLISMSKEVNSAFPFIDGMRFLPSFFLPMYLFAGLGAAILLRLARSRLEPRFAKLTGLSQTDFCICFTLAAIMPCAIVLLAYGITTIEILDGTWSSVLLSATYAGYAEAYSISGGERIFFVGENEVSQYPLVMKNFLGSGNVGYGAPKTVAPMMRSGRLRYLALSNVARNYAGEDQFSNRFGEYRALKESGLFVEIPTKGNLAMFELVGAGREAGALFFGNGVSFSNASVLFDRAHFEGVCGNADGCEILFFNDLPKSNFCMASWGVCSAKKDSAGWAWVVGGIPAGAFSLDVAPAWPAYGIPLIILCAVVLAVSFFLAMREK